MAILIIELSGEPFKREKKRALKTILLPLSLVKSVWTNVTEQVDDGDYGRMQATWVV